MRGMIYIPEIHINGFSLVFYISGSFMAKLALEKLSPVNLLLVPFRHCCNKSPSYFACCHSWMPRCQQLYKSCPWCMQDDGRLSVQSWIHRLVIDDSHSNLYCYRSFGLIRTLYSQTSTQYMTTALGTWATSCLIQAKLIQGNGYEKFLLYVFVLFFGLDHAQNATAVYFWQRS